MRGSVVMRSASTLQNPPLIVFWFNCNLVRLKYVVNDLK